MKTPKELSKIEDAKIKCHKEVLESELESVISKAIGDGIITSKGGVIEADILSRIYDSNIDRKITLEYLEKFGWNYQIGCFDGNRYKLRLYPIPKIEEH